MTRRLLFLIFIPVFLFAVENFAKEKSVDYNSLKDATLDVGVTLISAPSDTVDSNSYVIPRATVFNYGDTTVSFQVIFKEIELSYSNVQQITDLQPQRSQDVNFTPWHILLAPGTHVVKCSTALANDNNPSNDAYEKTIFCRVKDIAVLELILPDTVDFGTSLTPKAHISNLGNSQEFFWAIFSIDTVYICSLPVTNLRAYTDTILSFSSWTIDVQGNYTVSCSIPLTGDIHPNDNVLYDSLFIRNNDLGVSEILEPALIIPETSMVTPKVLVTNYGNMSVTGEVFFIITNSTSQIVYQDSNSITLDPQTSDSVTFTIWNAGQGLYIATSYTKSAGDYNPHNDTLTRYFFAGIPNRDVGAIDIIQPIGTVRKNPIRPITEVKNFGDLPETFYSFFKIRYLGNLVYNDSLLILSLPPGSTRQVTFSLWNPDAGTFLTEAYTILADDMHPENNYCNDSVVVETLDVGWNELAPVPSGPVSKPKPVKAGGSLVFVPPSFIYAFKGNNTNEFYCYDIIGDTWTEKETIPWVGKKKRVKDGAGLCYDNGHFIYALKGKNTQEFWRYNIETDSWATLKIVPFGNSSKQRKVKKGSCITFFPRWDGQNFVYLLKANSTFEFFAYWIEQDSWIFKPDAPGGPKQKKFKAGSCMTYDHNNSLIWVLKGGTNEFYAYDVNNEVWLEDKPNLPLMGSSGKKKKVRDGGSIAYSSATHSVYALKGGNTNEFWRYVPGDSWYPMDGIPDNPDGKKVKSGGALAFANGNFYALRGNKTYDFYVYNFGSGIGIEEPKITKPLPIYLGASLKVQPNPFSKTAQICYSFIGSKDIKTPVSIKLYNVTGRMVKVLVDDFVFPGTYNFNFNSGRLPKGIYFIRLTALNRQTSQKLIITRE